MFILDFYFCLFLLLFFFDLWFVRRFWLIIISVWFGFFCSAGLAAWEIECQKSLGAQEVKQNFVMAQ